MAEEKKEKRKKYMQEYYKKNKAKLKKQALNYYWENRDEIREKFLKKYHKNKNEIKKYQREYYKKNKEHILKKRMIIWEKMSNDLKEKYREVNNIRKKKFRKYPEEQAREKVIVKRIHKIMDGEKDLWNIRKKDKGRIITKNDWLKSGGFINIETFAHITGEPVKKIIGLAQKHGFNFTDNVHSAFLLFFDVVNVV